MNPDPNNGPSFISDDVLRAHIVALVARIERLEEAARRAEAERAKEGK